MKAIYQLLATLICLQPAWLSAQIHTVHAIHSTGPDGFSTGLQPNALDEYKGYLAIAEDRDGGGSAYDICIMWGDTCRGYNAKSRYYRTSGSNDESSYAVKIDPTGDLWVCGSSTGTGLGQDDAILMRLDTAANLPIVWAKAYGGAGGEAFTSLALTSDGGAIGVGSTNGFGAQVVDAYVAKVDASGNLQWSRTLGGSSVDQFSDVVQTSDGGYLCIGTTFSYSAIMNLLLVKLSPIGNLTFARILVNPANRWSVGYSITPTLDGGYILGGAEVNGNVSPNDADGMLLKLDAAFNVQWCKLYGGLGWDDLGDVTPTDDNGDQLKNDGYMAVGYNGTIGTSDEYWMVKTDATGAQQWSRAWDEGNTANGFVSVEQFSTAGGYFMIGTDDKLGAGHLMTMRTKSDGSGNFTCPTPLITPRVTSISRALTNIAPPFITVTGSTNATFTTYGFLSAIATCCCDNWPGNCRPAILDAGGRLALQLAARGEYVDVDWALESEEVRAYEVWSGPDPSKMRLAYQFDAEVHSLSDPVAARGVWYYEVRAMDANGQLIASAVRSIALGGGHAMWLESNRVKAGEHLQLHFAGESASCQRWEVMDLNGRSVLSGTATLDGSGSAVEILETGNWAAGMYVILGLNAVLRVMVQ